MEHNKVLDTAVTVIVECCCCNCTHEVSIYTRDSNLTADEIEFIAVNRECPSCNKTTPVSKELWLTVEEVSKEDKEHRKEHGTEWLAKKNSQAFERLCARLSGLSGSVAGQHQTKPGEQS